jgi:nucleotide-binding universal stress UspA family protein
MNTDARVVVGYDGRPDSLAALAWAAHVASLRGEAIVATTIIDPRETPRGVAWPESYWDEIDERARDVLARWPDLPATIERHVGHLVPRLLESAEGGSLLVVGSRGHNVVSEMLLGSVSQSAARHARLPVIVFREPTNPESGRIVVGASGSESSNRALEFACRMAELTGDKVVALGAWAPVPVVTNRYGRLPALSTDTMEAAEAQLGRIVDDLRQAHPEVAVQGEFYVGAAETGLTDAADNASLVVVGSHGYHAVGEVLMGSVSQALLHHAQCPVAVIH